MKKREMPFGYKTLHRSDSYVHLASASPSAVRRQPLRRASISSLTNDLSLNVQGHGLEQGRLHGLLQRIGHRRRQRFVNDQNDTSEKENYVRLSDEMEPCCPNSKPVSSLKATDKLYDDDAEIVFKKRHHHHHHHHHHQSQMGEADRENDPMMSQHQGSRGYSRLKEIGSQHLSVHSQPMRSSSFNAHGEYLQLREMGETIVSNHARPVRRTSFSSHGKYSGVEEVDLKDRTRLMQRAAFNVHSKYSQLKELNGTRTEDGHIYDPPLHCLTRQELHA